MRSIHLRVPDLFHVFFKYRRSPNNTKNDVKPPRTIWYLKYLVFYLFVGSDPNCTVCRKIIFNLISLHCFVWVIKAASCAYFLSHSKIDGQENVQVISAFIHN